MDEFGFWYIFLLSYLFINFFDCFGTITIRRKLSSHINPSGFLNSLGLFG